jgi:thimet oligopeptidase
MARRPENVRAFYEDLVPVLQRGEADELATLSAMLRADTGDPVLHTWDVRYYDAQLLRSEYGVETEKAAEFFPLGRVLEGLLGVTGEVFGVRYRQLPGAPTWHPDVLTYEILDGDSGDVLALFYADLFPREGKFSHAAAFPLAAGHRHDDGSRGCPVVAIVANLTAPSSDRPALLRHEEVVTLFHEFGHVLHHCLVDTSLARFAAIETEWEADFVEAPSQILEHWAWEPEVLRRFARHYRTGEPIPPDLVERLVAARDLNVAYRTLRQCYMGLLDLGLHDAATERDLDEINRVAHEVTGLDVPEGTFAPASFEHLFGGYDAGYYGYLWSKVFGDDMFSRFAAEGILSPVVGRAYRRCILEPGSARDAADLLRDFLGRPPSNAAFLRGLGIEPPAPG